MKKFIFIFVVASALLAGCSECSITTPEPGVLPPPEPSKGHSSGRVSAFSATVSDSTEKNTNTSAYTVSDKHQSKK